MHDCQPHPAPAVYSERCCTARLQNPTVWAYYCYAHHISLPLLRVPGRISFKLAVMTYRSVHGTSPSYPQSCFTRVADMTSTRRLFCLSSSTVEVPSFVSLLSASGRSQFLEPTCRTTSRSTTHLHSHSRFSDSVSRLSCSYRDFFLSDLVFFPFFLAFLVDLGILDII